MKKIKLLLMFAFFAAVFSLFVSASPQWVFDSADKTAGWAFEGCSSEMYENVLLLTAGTNDFWMTKKLTAEEKVDCSEYKYVAFNIRTVTEMKAGGIFFGTSVNPGPKGPEYSEFGITGDGKWHDYIIDMSEYSHGLWEGTLTALRLDPVNGTLPVGTQAYVGRIGVFNSKAEAQSFLDEQVCPCFEPQWVFNKPGEVEKWTANGCEVSCEDGVLSMNATSTDPNIKRVLSSGERVNCSEYKYVAFRFKTDTTHQNGALFFTTDTNSTLTNDNHVSYRLIADGQWNNYIIDMSSNANWKGELNMLRHDLQNDHTLVDAQLMLERLGVFKTVEAAEAFLGGEADEAIDGLYWTFDDEKNFSKWDYINASAKPFENVMLFRNYGNDPIMVNENIPGGYSCSEYKYVAFNMCTDTSLNHGLVFFATSKDVKLSDTKFVKFDIKSGGEWNDYIVDMTVNANWNGLLTILRLDPQNGGTDVPDNFYIGRIGLFKTREEAQKFLDKQKLPEISSKPAPQWIFGEDGDGSHYWYTKNAEADETFGVSNYHASTSDAQLIIDFKSKYDNKMQKFDASFQYAAVRYNASSVNNNSRYSAYLYFKTEGDTNFSQDRAVSAYIYPDGTYRDLIFDMSSCDNWSGTITSARLDLLNWNDVGDSFIIARIGFFETEKEAQDFLNADESLADFNRLYERRTDEYKTTILPGKLNYGYSIYDYDADVTLPEGECDSYVVVYSDEDGNENVVALSDVNVAGYVRYVAEFPGEYSIRGVNVSIDDIAGHWGEENINYTASRGVLCGTDEGEFSPDMPVTRGMFATAMGRMHGIDTDLYTQNAFSDVSENEYYAPYIQWAANNGIIEGVTQNEFMPEAPMTRLDMATAVYNYIDCYRFDVKSPGFYDTFADISDCAVEEREAIEYISRAGLVNGVDKGMFDPYGLLTRAETATVLSRVIKGVVGANYSHRFDREKFLIGAFGYNDYLYTPQNIRNLADMDVDVLMSGSADEELLRLLEEYNMAFIPGSRLHSWWGDNGENAGTYDDLHSPEDVAQELAGANKSEIIVSDYIVDEPSALDYEGINAVYQEYIRLTEGKTFPLVNLYPNYGKLYNPDDPTALSQLGTLTYKQYVDEFVEKVDVDYICFDNYPLGSEGSFVKYLQNLDEVAAACRDNDRDMWVIIQTGAWTENKAITARQLEWQMYTCMAYGTNFIIHACYIPGWWDDSTSCITTEGEKNPTYYYAQSANKEIHRMGDVFMEYDYLGTYGVGQNANTASNITTQFAAQNERNALRDGFDGIDGIEVTSDAGCLVGCFTAKDGDSKALMLVNCRDPFDKNDNGTVNVTLNVEKNECVTAYENGYSDIYTADANGNVTISIPDGEGVFVTVGR